MKITVKRSEWLRGKRFGESYLLREDGKKCCIGFLCLQAGLPEDDILYVDMIANLEEKFSQLQGFTIETSYPENEEKGWIHKAYQVNDDVDLTEQVREKALNDLAKSDGHEFIFVD